MVHRPPIRGISRMGDRLLAAQINPSARKAPPAAASDQWNSPTMAKSAMPIDENVVAVPKNRAIDAAINTSISRRIMAPRYR